MEVRGDRWRVVGTKRFDTCTAVHLAGASRTNAGRTRTLLHPFDLPRVVTRSLRLQCVGRRRWVRRLATLLARVAPPHGLRAAARADIDLFAWQLEPALALVDRGVTRLLLADDVGLGKTIEAALVVAELGARHALAHVLVVVPPGLRDQWAGELARRFGVEAMVADADSLARLRAGHLASTNPWGVPPVVLASLDLIKRPDVLAGPAGVIWDLLVVDEAHAVAAAPERHRAIATIARRSRRLLLLTATPHSGDDAAFRALCDLGREPGEPPILLVRRTRASLGIAGPRRVHRLRVRPSAAEWAMHRLLAQYSARALRESSARGDPSARLAMIVLAKRALSSAYALAVSLDRRATLLSATPGDPAAQLALPLDDDEDERQEDCAPSGLLAMPGFDDRRSECAWLQRLVTTARAAQGTESKMTALTRLVRRVEEPVVVFTEFADTLERVAGALGTVRPVLRLHGGVDRPARRVVLDRFAEGGPVVLAATDVGGQGLNLQARCRLVVSVELPWNPMRLEQRIGRVDRIGQRRRVHAIHLIANGTPEECILARLYARIASAEQAIGDVGAPLGAIEEADVAGAMLAGGADPPTAGPAASPAERLKAASPRRLSDCAGGPWRQEPASSQGPLSIRSMPSDRVLSSDEAPPAGAVATAVPDFERLPPEPSAGARAEQARLERVRRCQSLGSFDHTDEGLVPVARASCRRLGLRLPPGMLDHARWLVVYAACVVDASGALVEDGLWPVVVSGGGERPFRGRLVGRRPTGAAARDALEAMVRAGDPEWSAAAVHAVVAGAEAIAAARRGAWRTRRTREVAILGALEAERAERGQPVQAGLFDHAELDEARRSLAAIDALIVQARIGSPTGGALSIAGTPELVLVLALDP